MSKARALRIPEERRADVSPARRLPEVSALKARPVRRQGRAIQCCTFARFCRKPRAASQPGLQRVAWTGRGEGFACPRLFGPAAPGERGWTSRFRLRGAKMGCVHSTTAANWGTMGFINGGSDGGCFGFSKSTTSQHRSRRADAGKESGPAESRLPSRSHAWCARSSRTSPQIGGVPVRCCLDNALHRASRQ